MTAFLRRIAYWLGKREPNATTLAAIADSYAGRLEPPTGELRHLLVENGGRVPYLHDFGPNVPVEDLGGKPVENNQPVYPGREKAP